jgi:plasmid maintenance system antidote protein VapI
LSDSQLTKETRVVAPTTNLGAMLRTFMAMERWSMRTLAPEIGVSSATLHRICAGYDMDADTLLKVINWMMRSRV